MSGIQTKNLPLRQSLNELIGHDSQDSTARITLQALSRLIGHDIAQEIAATGGVGIFATANAGVSATDPGDYFAVAGSGDDYLILYRNVSGSAQEISRAPSLEAVETLIGQATVTLDFNAIERSGFYSSSNTAGETENTPEGLGQIGLFHIEGSNNRRHQLAFRMNTSEPTMWVRAHFQSSGWGDWKELAWQEGLDALESTIGDGLGAIEQSVETLVGEATLSADFNEIEKSGFYRGSNVPGETIGAPTDNAYLGLLHIKKQGPGRHQLAFRQSSSEVQMWVRSGTGSGWSPWREVGFLRGTNEAELSLDWDAIDRSGFYRGSDSSGQTDGAPVDNPFLGLFHFHKPGTGRHQMAFRQNSYEPQVWVRSAADGSYSPWRELAMTSHLSRLYPYGEFYTGDEDRETAFSLVDEDGMMLAAWSENGQQVVGGSSLDTDDLPLTEQEVAEGQAWNDRSLVSVRPALLAVNKTSTRTMFPLSDDVHQYLDDLVAEFPDYLSMEKIGEDHLGNDINAYRAKPPRYVQVSQDLSYPESQVLKPKIILVSGTHGNEIHCVSANIILLEEICREWRRIERLDQYRWGLDLILVPVANPSGYNANTRDTSAGVNLNRNFPTRWSSSAESGASPASEPETQALIALMEAHDDAIGLIDHHRMFQHQADGERLVWVATEGSGNVGLGLNAVNASVAEVKRRFPFVPQGNDPVGAISAHFDGALGLHADTLGIPGFMLETPNAVSGNNSHVYTHARRCLDNLIWEILQKELRRRSVEHIL